MRKRRKAVFLPPFAPPGGFPAAPQVGRARFPLRFAFPCSSGTGRVFRGIPDFLPLFVGSPESGRFMPAFAMLRTPFSDVVTLCGLLFAAAVLVLIFRRQRRLSAGLLFPVPFVVRLAVLRHGNHLRR